MVAHRNTKQFSVFSTLMALARWTYGRVPWMRWESFCQYWKGWKWPRSVHALGHLRTPQDTSGRRMLARWWAIRKRYWMIFHVFWPRGFLNHVRLLDRVFSSSPPERLVPEAALEAVRTLQVHWEDVRKGNPYPRRLKAARLGQWQEREKMRVLQVLHCITGSERSGMFGSNVLHVSQLWMSTTSFSETNAFSSWDANFDSTDQLRQQRLLVALQALAKRLEGAESFCFQMPFDTLILFASVARDSVSSPGKASTVGVFCNKHDTAEQAAAPSLGYWWSTLECVCKYVENNLI